jgi:hypothetical protein
MSINGTSAATGRTIDLTGLPESVVQEVLQLVAAAMPKSQEPAPDQSLPLPLADWWAEYAAAKRAAAERSTRYPADHVLDDSRDTIYGDRERV